MKRKHVAAALALALTLGFLTALVAPSPAEALPPCGWHAEYYSDGTYTDLIGERWYTPEDCGCFLDGWGSEDGSRKIVNDPVCSWL